MRLTFIHGWASSPQIWQPLKRCLGGNYQFSCLTLPWLDGVSEQSAPLVPVQNYVNANLPGLSKADVIVGWSLGGLIAAEFINQCTEWNGQLVLIAAPLKFVAEAKSDVGIDEQVLTAFIDEFEHSPMQVIDRFMALQARGDEFARSNRKALKAALDYCADMKPALRNGLMLLKTMDYRFVLAKKRLNSLVIHGENDQVVSWRASEQMCRQANITSFHLIPCSGHAPHVSHAEQVAEIIQASIRN